MKPKLCFAKAQRTPGFLGGQEAKQDDAEPHAGQQPRYLLSRLDFTNSAQDRLPPLPPGASQRAAQVAGSVLILLRAIR